MSNELRAPVAGGESERERGHAKRERAEMRILCKLACRRRFSLGAAMPLVALVLSIRVEVMMGNISESLALGALANVAHPDLNTD